MAEELSTASIASVEVLGNRLPPRSSAPRLACDISTRNWSRKRAPPQNAREIRAETSSTCEVLPKHLARVFSALHSADMETRAAAKLEMEVLFVGHEMIELSRRDPVLVDDLRRVLASLGAINTKQPCDFSTDGNETKNDLQRSLQMAQDPEPARVAADTRPCIRKPLSISTSCIGRTPSTAIRRRAFAAYNLPQNLLKPPDNDSQGSYLAQQCQNRIGDVLSLECCGPCETWTRYSNHLRDTATHTKGKSVLGVKDDQAGCVSTSDELPLSFISWNSARLFPKPGTSLGIQDEYTDVDTVVNPVSEQGLSLALTRSKEHAPSEIPPEIPRPFSFSKGDDAEFARAWLNLGHTNTCIGRPGEHDNALPKPASQQGVHHGSSVWAMPVPRQLAIDPPCSTDDKHVDSVMPRFSEHARMLMWNSSRKTMVGRISVDSIVANSRSATPPHTRVADSTITWDCEPPCA